jgi:hypothetical protein
MMVLWIIKNLTFLAGRGGWCLCNSSSWETKAGGSRVQNQPGLYSEFETSLGYVTKPCLKKKKSPFKLKFVLPIPQSSLLDTG